MILNAGIWYPLLCLCFPGWWRGSFNMSAILNLSPPLAFLYSPMHVENPPHCMLGIQDQYLRMIYLYRSVKMNVMCRWHFGFASVWLINDIKWPFLVLRRCPKCIQFDSPGQACSQDCPRGGSSSAFCCTSAWAALCQLAGSTQGGMGERWMAKMIFLIFEDVIWWGVFFFLGETPRDLIKRRK